ncbi:hypothetical protein [Lentibacillus saliphilus]|uniref:hypothetical protein n=1 Tax=Lentibacillus saliphilus TaxID=2737028 RepID=UPI001C302DFA|nr:hypothetical protein [Lentibacillus saliphilus]
MGQFIKRMTVYVFLYLLVTSVYHDITTGTGFEQNTTEPSSPSSSTIDDQSVVKVKIRPGDTVLSIMEQIHSDSNKIEIDTIIEDFRKLNPKADPYHLKVGNVYYFPTNIK